jgi:hypothetical protein
MAELWEILDAEFGCECAETKVCRKADRLGRPYYVRQCLRCGGESGAVKRESIHIKYRLAAGPPDAALREAWNERREARRRELCDERRKARDDEYWREMDAYLQSAWWRGRREARLEMDSHRCQAKLPGCAGRAAQVHHLSYKHLGAEPLFDLASVCAPCHDRITEQAATNRGGPAPEAGPRGAEIEA